MRHKVLPVGFPLMGGEDMLRRAYLFELGYSTNLKRLATSVVLARGLGVDRHDEKLAITALEQFIMRPCFGCTGSGVVGPDNTEKCKQCHGLGMEPPTR